MTFLYIYLAASFVASAIYMAAGYRHETLKQQAKLVPVKVKKHPFEQ